MPPCSCNSFGIEFSRCLKLPLSFGDKQKDMRHRYVVLVLTAVCVAAVLLCWQRKINAKRAAAVAPYTAHLIVTKNRVLTDGSSWNTVSTKILAHDRQGRTYEKAGHVFQDGEQRTEWLSFFVQDPAKRQTLTWDSKSQVAVVTH